MRYFLELYTGACPLCGHPADSHGVEAKMALTDAGAVVLQETPADKGCLVAVENGRCKCARLFDVEGTSPFKVTSSPELIVHRHEFFIYLLNEGVYNEGMKGEIMEDNDE